MKIGDRIRKYRKIRKATQLDLGYHVKLSDLRIGQYETGKRNPKETVINNIAQALDVEPNALKNSDIDTIDGLMHILFELEDVYGLAIHKYNIMPSRTLDYEQAPDFFFQFSPSTPQLSVQLGKALSLWKAAYEKYHPALGFATTEEKENAENKYALWKAQFPNNLIQGESDVICREDMEIRL